ncbi:hypothetical protein L1887_56909 [Cichorium endivia]|nr:hypothetical protein L1887_56909 [Cichorium endivia]
MTPLMVMVTKGNGVDGNDGEILLNVLVTVVLVRLRSAQGLFMERRPKASIWLYPGEGQLLISSRRTKKPSTTTPATPATPAGAHIPVWFFHGVEQTESTLSPLALTPRTTKAQSSSTTPATRSSNQIAASASPPPSCNGSSAAEPSPKTQATAADSSTFALTKSFAISANRSALGTSRTLLPFLKSLRYGNGSPTWRRHSRRRPTYSSGSIPALTAFPPTSLPLSDNQGDLFRTFFCAFVFFFSSCNALLPASLPQHPFLNLWPVPETRRDVRNSRLTSCGRWMQQVDVLSALPWLPGLIFSQPITQAAFTAARSSG